MARVLPVPAPASTDTGPRQASATVRCSGSSAASSWSASIRPMVPYFTGRHAGHAGRSGREKLLHHTEIAVSTNMEGPVPLTMYTTTWCGFCKNLKRQLGKAGIELNEVDIELDPEAAKFVESVNGGNQTV